ncbi:histidine phosphatase family protein [Nocardioides sp. CFH 31398]|uniref:histidine phosphatase family protein n=1 Tax=Nocardioides sp. CFH 31398 TaxID=2919579 RepID=UPI001F051EA8|nr:histidine phosphatase family protein [Nocardioides sp. CFH 31398]MCH1868480.1 histidine phosphatase family protein [Nocardioides sp. CFH 31398]
MTTDPTATPTPQAPSRGWGGGGGPTTTLVLVRHGVTVHTAAKRFSGGLGGANPPLSEDGVAQARATAEWLAPELPADAVLVTSPVRRTVETAGLLAAVTGLGPAVEEPGVAETDFGSWEGLTFGEVREADAAALDSWVASPDVPAGGTGESFAAVRERVLAARDRLLASYAGRTVVVVSHVTPIKVLVADALGAPLGSLYAMELSPASVTVLAHGGDWASMRAFDAGPHGLRL